MKKQRGLSPLKIAATYIGTIVGAGFATGQETLVFFSRFGAWGLLGLGVVTGLFIAFGYIIMALGRRFNARSHLEVIRFANGRFIGGAVDAIILFFLFGALCAMIAGTGALIAQQYRLPAMTGNLLMAALTVFTVLAGFRGVINAISYVVPFLLAAVVGTSLCAILAAPPALGAPPPPMGEGLVGNWALSAALYVSYNTIVAVSVLAPLGAQARDARAIGRGALLGGLGLGLGAVMIYLALSGSLWQLADVEVPMMYIAQKISPLWGVAYTVVLIAEIYTTAVGALYGFAARLVKASAKKSAHRAVVVGATAAALLASRVGFSNLVQYLYPLVGYGGLVMLIGLLTGYVRARRQTGKSNV